MLLRPNFAFIRSLTSKNVIYKRLIAFFYLVTWLVAIPKGTVLHLNIYTFPAEKMGIFDTKLRFLTRNQPLTSTHIEFFYTTV